jgi:hypothetical protein
MNEAPVDRYTNPKELPKLLYSGVKIFKTHAGTADINRTPEPMPAHFAGRLGQFSGMQAAPVPTIDHYRRTKVIPELLKQGDEIKLHTHHAAMFAAYF